MFSSDDGGGGGGGGANERQARASEHTHEQYSTAVIQRAQRERKKDPAITTITTQKIERQKERANKQSDTCNDHTPEQPNSESALDKDYSRGSSSTHRTVIKASDRMTFNDTLLLSFFLPSSGHIVRIFITTTTSSSSAFRCIN